MKIRVRNREAERIRSGGRSVGVAGCAGIGQQIVVELILGELPAQRQGRAVDAQRAVLGQRRERVEEDRGRVRIHIAAVQSGISDMKIGAANGLGCSDGNDGARIVI